MIIDIRQTKASGGNEFEVIVDGITKYTSINPWFNLRVPLGLEEIRKSCMYDLQGEKIFHMEYNTSENLIHRAIPLKYLVGIEQKHHIFSIVDKDDIICGGFYQSFTGVLSGRYVIGYGDEVFYGYRKASGKVYNISIYSGENQIAHIIKGFAVKDLLDNYKLYIKSGYEYLLEILSFFTIYFDRLSYNNNGFVYYKGTSVNTQYTWDKYNKYYNPNWIKDTFGENVYHELHNEIKTDRDKALSDFKKWMPVVWIGLGVLAVLMVVLFFVL